MPFFELQCQNIRFFYSFRVPGMETLMFHSADNGRGSDITSVTSLERGNDQTPKL
jgi:hypothetical protein